jgi:hypothetical protein
MSNELILSPPRYRLFRNLRCELTQLLRPLLVSDGLAVSSLPLLFVMAVVMSILSPRADFPDMNSDQVAFFLVQP